MVVRVTQPQTKAYAYNRESYHGHEKEVVFASGAKLTRVREARVSSLKVSRVTSGTPQTKVVPAYLVEAEIS